MRSRPCPCGIVPAVGLGKRCTYSLQMGGRRSSSPMAHGLREGGAGLPWPAGPPCYPGPTLGSRPTRAQGSPGQPGPTTGSSEPDPGAGPGLASPGQGGALPGPLPRPTRPTGPTWSGALPPHGEGVWHGGGSPTTLCRRRKMSCRGAPVSLSFQKITPLHIDNQFT
jgi:hypothetical protein